VRNGLELVGQLLGHAVRRSIIHLHTNGHNRKSWLLTVACACAGLLGGRRTVVSIGSGAAPTFITASRGPARLVMRTGLGLVGAVICRNERMRQALVGVGVRPDKITILSGFYGVSTDELPDVPPEVAVFLRQQSPVVAALAEPGPEYGIRLLLQAVARLQTRHPRLGLILIGPGSVEASAGGGRVLWTGELAHDVALSVMRKVSVFVRPTYYDGDASSVREALALGVPVVASDTDFRPEGVMLFRRGDVDSLVHALAQALERGSECLPRVPSAAAGSFDRLLAIYESLAPARRIGPREGRPVSR
jgi:glycosyltransferase involved in cell wall biosynthesis